MHCYVLLLYYVKSHVLHTFDTFLGILEFTRLFKESLGDKILLLGKFTLFTALGIELLRAAKNYPNKTGITAG